MLANMKLAILCYMTLLGIAASENCHTDRRNCHTDRRIETVQKCITDCPFANLEEAMNNASENGLKVWTAFHHPRKALPVYLVVKYWAYDASGHKIYETYLWTSNSIYFAIPPHVFGFISLFVGILDYDHTGEVDLTLPLRCSCWLNGSMYFTEKECSVMNYLEILTEKLRTIANLSGNPRMISNYQYRSSAIRKDSISDVYHICGPTFFSFLFLSPVLGTIAYVIIVSSQHKAIEELMTKPERHHNIAALISLGFIFALCTTILDCIAAGNPDKTIYHHSKYNPINHKFQYLLIASTALEVMACSFGITWFSILCIFQCYGRIKSEDPGVLFCCKHPENNQYWWILLFLFIPPIWCLPSTFGFIILAWSSFLRHSKSLTLLYIFTATTMFLVMRQVYKLCINIRYGCCLNEDEIKDRQEKDGVLFWAILVAFVVGVVMVCAFIWLVFGLWLLPVTELVEESPVYLYDSLQLVVVVLAILVSYQLISFKENEIKKALKEDVNESLKNSRNTLSRILITLEAREARAETPATPPTLVRRRSLT